MTGRCEHDLQQCEIVYHLAGSQSDQESVIVWLYIEVHHQMKLSWTRNANNQRMFYPQCYSNCNIGLAILIF